MKHLKTFEDVEDTYKPELGDYVYCLVPKGDYIPNEFIGILTKIIPGDKAFPYNVKFPITNNPEVRASDVNDRIIRKEEVKYFSKTLKELNSYIDSIKYNL